MALRIENAIKRIKKTSTCWLWTGQKNNTGYGVFGWYDSELKKTKSNSAHRVIYELLVAEIPLGLDLDHLCKNRLCVNPEHLEPVTRHENLMRSETNIVTINKNKIKCLNGHAFTKENTYERKDRTTRECKKCRYNATLKSYRKRVCFG